MCVASPVVYQSIYVLIRTTTCTNTPHVVLVRVLKAVTFHSPVASPTVRTFGFSGRKSSSLPTKNTSASDHGPPPLHEEALTALYGARSLCGRTQVWPRVITFGRFGGTALAYACTLHALRIYGRVLASYQQQLWLAGVESFKAVSYGVS